MIYKKYSVKDKLSSLSHNQLVLFQQRIDTDIVDNHPVSIVNTIVDNLNLEAFNSKEAQLLSYPQTFKGILYAYLINIYSCHKIEKLLLRGIHYIWLFSYKKPYFITINRFRNRVKNEINNIFIQVMLIFAAKGLITLDVKSSNCSNSSLIVCTFVYVAAILFYSSHF